MTNRTWRIVFGAINAGCAFLLIQTDAPLEGWDNLDIKQGRAVYPLDMLDASVDEIRASHVLEHFPRAQAMAVLREWVRVLKPGGLLRVAVPDFGVIAEAYVAGEALDTEGYVMGGQVDRHDFHHALYDRAQHAL